MVRLPRFYLFHFVNLTSGRTAPMGPTELDMKIDRTHLSREKKSERETAVVSRGRRARMEKLIFCGHPVPSALQIGENPDEYDGEARERVYVICAFGTLCFFSFFPSFHIFSSVVAIKCHVNFLGGVSDASPFAVCVT